jgi:hypothetical protein
MVVATLGQIGVVGPLAIAAVLAAQETFTREFHLENADLSSSGHNPYFRLEPGYMLTLGDGATQLVVTVLTDTKMVDGVETRVVEERETKQGQLIEVSRNYFAISARTNSVFYFGEDVDMYKAGKVVSHEGAWMAGVDGARAGLMMPGLPLLRARFYQEWAPRVAMDRAEIVSMTESRRTPAGSFTDVLKVEETTPLEPGVREYKYYARDVGLIQDGSLVLVKLVKAGHQ